MGNVHCMKLHNISSASLGCKIEKIQVCGEPFPATTAHWWLKGWVREKGVRGAESEYIEVLKL